MAAAKLVEDKQAEDKASILSSDTVKEFLTQYYTKEKLGENNTRIQPYMTESAYSQELTSQNDAMNQVYKDYILDYHFEKADIFVNQTTNQAIAMVSYNVTYVSDLKNANHDADISVKLVSELLVNQVQVWKSGLDDLDKATPKTLEESSSVPSLPNTTTKWWYFMNIEECKQISILDVANRLGISFKQVYDKAVYWIYSGVKGQYEY